MIMIDDGSSITHSDRTTLPYPINTGDTISAVIGPLAYTFGRYKIEPIAVPDIQPKEVDLPTLEPPEMDEFSLMTWNVENLFDILDPHPSDPPRPSLAEYKNALAKVANTILAAGAPTLIALQEVENLAILEDIAAHPNLAQTPYQPVLIEGYDSRGIDVGYLVRKDRASILEVKQLIAPEGLTSRPPLMLHLLVQTSAGETELFVINNHFTSMSGGVEITEPARAAQAAWNVQISQEILAEYPQAAIAILGDLNSFFVSRPIQALREAGFAHVMDALPAQERYTYIYQGESEVLDHILVTSNLYGILERVEILHVNADYAPAIPEDQSPLRKSDHDPLIATFKP
jgi:predicted extracellular nuclease